MDTLKIWQVKSVVNLFIIVGLIEVIVGGVIGFEVGKGYVPIELKMAAYTKARAEVEAQMTEVCANWHTDAKTAKLPEGRIVVCKAPKWMSNPTVQ